MKKATSTETTKMKIEKIRKEVKNMDPNLDARTMAFKAAVCLLSGLQVGTNPSAIAEFTGFPLKTVQGFAEHLVKSGVWNDGKTYCNWFDEEHGGIAFWCDVAVAQGYLQRTPA